MKTRQPVKPDRIRKIEGTFGFIEHRFLHEGFFHDLSHRALTLYLFLVLVSDRRGVSYYMYDKICSITKMSLDDYIKARDTLIEKDLIAFEEDAFQVLSLPRAPKIKRGTSQTSPSRGSGNPESLAHIFSRLSRGEP